MKKLVLLFLIVIFSCQTQKTDKGVLEGVWEREASIQYENGQPMDTFPFGDEINKAKMFKVYTKSHVMWLNNGKNIDSLTGEDLYPGAGAFATKYSVMNDELMEYLVLGTDNVASWFEPLILEGEKGYKFTAKVDVSENHYSQGNLDSLGNGFFELWKRIE